MKHQPGTFQNEHYTPARTTIEHNGQTVVIDTAFVEKLIEAKDRFGQSPNDGLAEFLELHLA